MERNKNTDSQRGMQKISDVTYNEQAGASKVLGPILGSLVNKGEVPVVATALSSGNSALYAFYNTNADTQFIQTAPSAGDLSSAPILTTGICLPPNVYILITPAYRDVFIRASTTGIVMYLVQDDSFIRDSTPISG